MATVKHLIESKKIEKNYSVAHTDSVLNALELMAEVNIGAVLVTEGEKIVGIFSERDYARKVELRGKESKNTPIKDVMTKQMITVTTDTTVNQCMALMKQHSIRHLPVVENDKLIGLVSMRDVVVVIIKESESTIKGLENYILGSGFAT